MAKTKLRRGLKRYRKTERTVRTSLRISRDNKRFVACLVIGTPGYRAGGAYRNLKQDGACGEGSNPRKAVADALHKSAKSMEWRGNYGKGAFEGLRRRR
jgi:hypothetical protein